MLYKDTDKGRFFVQPNCKNCGRLLQIKKSEDPERLKIERCIHCADAVHEMNCSMHHAKGRPCSCNWDAPHEELPKTKEQIAKDALNQISKISKDLFVESEKIILPVDIRVSIYQTKELISDLVLRLEQQKDFWS